jgi:zinc protease
VLRNGAVVIAKQATSTPAVTIHASLKAGSVFDPPDRAGVAHFVSKTLDRGTDAQPADQIAEALDDRGVGLAITMNRHAISLVCTCLVEDLDAILTLLADIIIHPSFPENEVTLRRGEIVTLIRQDEDNPSAMATEGMMADLYGPGHPYGRRPRGSAADVESIDRRAVQTFHATRFRPSALSLVMVGDIEPARAIAAGEAAFSEWTPSPLEPLQLPAPANASSRHVRAIPMMNKAQTDIAYGFVSVLRSDPSYYAYWLMNNVLGQYAIGGRLGDSIRERQGMAYYVFSTLDANVIPGPLTIRAGVSPANVERAIASIDEELTRMTVSGPTETEMKESRQYLIGSMPRTLETNIGIANFLQTSEFFGLGLDYDLQVPELLEAVTREQVIEAARTVLVPARATVVIAGPYAGNAQ